MQWLLFLGVATGMRTMTAMAVLCWFAALGYTPTHGWAFWAGYKISAILFTLGAFGEYYGDTLPQCPNRTDLGPAAARIVFGSLAGALAANTIRQPVAGGIILGLLGALLGTWGGIRVRAWLTKVLGRPLVAALLESAAALAIAIWCAHELAWSVHIFHKWWV